MVWVVDGRKKWCDGNVIAGNFDVRKCMLFTQVFCWERVMGRCNSSGPTKWPQSMTQVIWNHWKKRRNSSRLSSNRIDRPAALWVQVLCNGNAVQCEFKIHCTCISAAATLLKEPHWSVLPNSGCPFVKAKVSISEGGHKPISLVTNDIHLLFLIVISAQLVAFCEVKQDYSHYAKWTQ
jgi:hypothetical protein